MTEDTWRIIPIQRGHPLIGESLVLRMSKTKRGSARLMLSIPLYIRKKSEYFKVPTMHCNLLEKNSLFMIQFIPEQKADNNSRTICNGGLWLPPRNFKSYLSDHQKRTEVPYHLDNGNIIIDREILKDAKEIKE